MAEVFISHRGADTPEAERLAADLRTAGHHVRLDTWEVTVGDSIVGWMDEALGRSRYLVLCLSAHGLTGNWTNREWMSTLARQLEGASVKILPIRLTGGQLPPVLSDIRCADLSADYAAGLGELLRALR